MKIYVNRIPPKGCVLEEAIDSGQLDLGVESLQFRGPLKVKADVCKITNALTVSLGVAGTAIASCSRCLKEFELPLEKHFKLNYALERPDQILDLIQDIREEIILGYPIQFLCDFGCKGLCPQCGMNLNEGKCGCGA